MCARAIVWESFDFAQDKILHFRSGQDPSTSLRTCPNATGGELNPNPCGSGFFLLTKRGKNCSIVMSGQKQIIVCEPKALCS
jgi:hypothetical protein